MKSESAIAVKAIKAELKANFPAVKFSVTSDSFSGGNAVDIQYKDGPTVAQVEKITDKYQYGSFNGMEDIYECDNRIEGLPQAKYVHVSRDLSEESKLTLTEQVKKMFNLPSHLSYNSNTEFGYICQLVHSEFSNWYI